MSPLRFLVLAFLASAPACSGDATPAPTVPQRVLDGEPAPAHSSPDAAPSALTSGTSQPKPPAPPPLSVEQACARFKLLRAQSCDWTSRFPAGFVSASNCESSLRTWVSPDRPDREELAQVMSCWGLDCDPARECMVAAKLAQPPAPPRACGDEGTAPIHVDAATYAARRGASAKRYADVQTSLTEPVEVCGISGEVEWMMRARCGDGTTPYTSAAAVNDGRDAWFERGGRCNSVLDRYSVKCPENTYVIHIDRYICPPAAP